VYFITHPDVIIDPEIPVPQWPLSRRGKERMKKLLTRSWIDAIDSVYSSTEQKAIDGAKILAEHLEIENEMVEELGEVDRSSTGYLPYEEHEATAKKLFAYPDKSIRGWETARQAQQRIVQAVEEVVANDKGDGDIVIVSHGGVGVLYLCHLKGCPISLKEGPPGANGGSYYCFDAQSKSLIHDWKQIDE
jgi:broad specificity phosphatase PhoE